MPNNDAQIKQLLEEGENFFLAGKFASAIAKFDEVIRLDANQALAWSNRGLAKSQLGQYEEAIKEHDNAIELAPQHASFWSNRGLAKSQLGQYGEAIKDFDKTIEIAPDNVAAWSNRGSVKNELGQYADAIKDFDTALELDPRNAGTWSNRGEAKSRLGKYEEAIKDLDKALELDPNKAAAWNNRAGVKNELGQYNEAIKDFDKAIELKPDEARGWHNRATAYAHLRDFDQAIQDAEQALKLAPENPNIQNNLAAIRAEKIAHEALTERLGRLENVDDFFQQETKNLERDYKDTRTERDDISKSLRIVISWIAGTLTFLLLAFVVLLFYLFFSGNSDSFTNEGYQWIVSIVLSIWLVLSVSVSVPILINLRIKTREVDELRALMYDYKRLQYLKSYSEFYQSDVSKETRENIVKRIIEHMSTQSPVETLIKLRGKNSKAPNNHPIEDVIEKGAEAIKNAPKPKD